MFGNLCKCQFLKIIPKSVKFGKAQLNSSIMANNLLFYKNTAKFVSGNRDKQVENEDKYLDKFERFWEDIDKQLQFTAELEKQIEKKHNDETFYIGPNIKDGKIPDDPQIESSIVDVYYVPLTKEDASLLEYFSNTVADNIIKGGRIVLLNEIKNYNRSKQIESHLPLPKDFDPLTAQEIKELKKHFYELYENEKVFNFILQQGRKCYTSLNKIKTDKVEQYTNFLNKLKYVDHYGEVMKSIPFNTKISIEFKQYPDPVLVKMYFDNKRINEGKLVNELKDIYFNFYNEIEKTMQLLNTERNKTFKDLNLNEGLNKIKNKIEPCLFDRMHSYIDYLRFNNLNFTFERDKNFQEEEKFYIFEKLFIKGVSLNRYDNSEPGDNILIDSHEDIGIRYYLNKYLFGESNNTVFERDPLTPISDILSKDYNHSLNYNIKMRNRKIIIRVYMFLKHPFTVKLNEMFKMNNNETNLLSYPDNYTYNHLAIFENELDAPNHTYLINNNFESWLCKHNLDLKNWKLVDVDNFMKGNPFFIKKSSFQDYLVRLLNDENFALNVLEKTFPQIVKPEEIQFTVSTTVKSTKKSKKDKKKEEKLNDKEHKKNAVIDNLSFDYRVAKIREYKEPIPKEDEDDIAAIEKEYNTIINNQIDTFLKEAKEEEEFKNELELPFNSHLKLEQLVQKFEQIKNKPIKKLELPEVEIKQEHLNELNNKNYVKKTDKEIKKSESAVKDISDTVQYKNNIEKLVNKLFLRSVKRQMNKEI